MTRRGVEARGVRVGFRTLCSLVLCAAAAGAAMAHAAIDVVGDFALVHDSYDDLAHGSRELITCVALVIAVVLALRGLRRCCEIATVNRTRLLGATLRARDVVAGILAAVSASCALVPAMEWLDGRVDGVAVRSLSEAFGGSLLVGLVTTVICASLIAVLVMAIARWLISHRDIIVAIIATLVRRNDDALRPSSCTLGRHRLTFRPRPAHALRLSKRGPPVSASA